MTTVPRIGLALVVSVLFATDQAHAGLIFSVDVAPDGTGLSYATSVFDFTTPVVTTGGEGAILGAPDHPGGNDPNIDQIVDFGGGDPSTAWSVSVGFDNAFVDGAGVDLKVFGVQLGLTEGFELLASADGSSFTSLGTFSPSAIVNSTFSVNVDFNGILLPTNSRYLRFVGTTVPIADSTLGFDFDAVGVVHQANAVPEPSSIAMLGIGVTGLCSYVSRRKRRAELVA